MKPLFIPLKKQHYLKFLDGSKTVEYRKAGIGSRWNRRVCEIGRPVVLSNGYGKSGRINGIITGFKESRRSGTRRGIRGNIWTWSCGRLYFNTIDIEIINM